MLEGGDPAKGSPLESNTQVKPVQGRCPWRSPEAEPLALLACFAVSVVQAPAVPAVRNAATTAAPFGLPRPVTGSQPTVQL